ncbi:MAG: DUF1194 domain-containing protein [Paracoccaceae bacterium]
MVKHGQYRALVGAFAALLAAGPATAGCRLALVLAVDVSRSVSESDYEVQRQGLIAALTAPEVKKAMFAPGGYVALSVYEWSGKSDQQVMVPWTAMQGTPDLDSVVAQIRAHERHNLQLPTGMGEALAFGRDHLTEAPDCAAQTIDMSGDGQNNEGRTPAQVYAAEDFGSIAVNGLPIGEHESFITDYYRAEVIRGTGAFVEPAPSEADYPRAIRRKLLKELSVQLIGDNGRGADAG